MRLDEAQAPELDQTRPIAPQVYAALRERIVRHDLKPGNRISESEIAALYGVSRQPVREAFIRLAGEGLLQVRPQRGTIVNRIGFAAVLDARFLREAIESDIVRLLATDPDPPLVADLRAQIAAQAAAAERSPREFMQLDDLFHRTLADGAGKAGAWKLIEGLKSQMDRVRFMALRQFPLGKLLEQHSGIVECIAAGDAGAAETAIRLHLREVLNDLPEILEAMPEFFDLPAGGVPAPVNLPIQGGGNP